MYIVIRIRAFICCSLNTERLLVFQYLLGGTDYNYKIHSQYIRPPTKIEITSNFMSSYINMVKNTDSSETLVTMLLSGQIVNHTIQIN